MADGQDGQSDYEPTAGESKGKKKKRAADGEADGGAGKKKVAKKAAKKEPAEKKAGRAGGRKANGATCRYDSSLGLLTKKFVVLLQEASDGVLDLNQAATTLEVQKRRIYDITNVLEGIGLIFKKSKNNIQWRGAGLAGINEQRREVGSLRNDIEEMRRQEGMVDQYIQRMQSMLQELSNHPDNAHLAYVTHEDIRSLPHFAGQTLIAVKAPSGTTLEVPDPDEGMTEGQRRYQIFLRSTAGPIDVYLLTEHERDASSSDLTSAAETADAATHGLEGGVPGLPFSLPLLSRSLLSVQPGAQQPYRSLLDASSPALPSAGRSSSSSALPPSLSASSSASLRYDARTAGAKKPRTGGTARLSQTENTPHAPANSQPPPPDNEEGEGDDEEEDSEMENDPRFHSKHHTDAHDPRDFIVPLAPAVSSGPAVSSLSSACSSSGTSSSSSCLSSFAGSASATPSAVAAGAVKRAPSLTSASTPTQAAKALSSSSLSSSESSSGGVAAVSRSQRSQAHSPTVLSAVSSLSSLSSAPPSPSHHPAAGSAASLQAHPQSQSASSTSASAGPAGAVGARRSGMGGGVESPMLAGQAGTHPLSSMALSQLTPNRSPLRPTGPPGTPGTPLPLGLRSPSVVKLEPRAEADYPFTLEDGLLTSIFGGHPQTLSSAENDMNPDSWL